MGSHQPKIFGLRCVMPGAADSERKTLIKGGRGFFAGVEEFVWHLPNHSLNG